jgi:hypothetical protein
MSSPLAPSHITADWRAIFGQRLARPELLGVTPELGCRFCPSEFSVTLLAARRCRLGASSRNWLPVQSFWSDEVPLSLVPRSHLAVGHFLGCVVFLRQTAPITVKQPVRPLFGFHLPPEFCPTSPSLPAATGKHLSWAFVPFSTRGFEGPPYAGLPTRYVPPSGFGHPLGGLLPSSPCRLFFAPAALMGFTLRSFLLSEGIAAFPRRRTRIPLFPSVIPPPKRWAGPTGRGFRVLTLPRVPGSRTGVNSPTAGCSLGFHPLRAF